MKNKLLRRGFGLVLATMVSLAPASAATPPKNYPQTLVEGRVAALPTEADTSIKKLQWAYDRLIENTYFTQPVGLDCWQWRNEPGAPAPDYLETRAISPLAFGLGSCEDYAAALTLVLRGLGFSANYLPGITLSIEGQWVDHAWVTVQFEGGWYHLDPQLEDNVLRDGIISYRYFLKTDAQMRVDHRWGQNMLDTIQLTENQRAEVRARYLFGSTGPVLAPPTARRMNPAPRPSRAAVQELLQKERAAYAAANGVVDALEITATPPVFGTLGYGPED